MKYGPIICDPNSEEAKNLLGKKVIANDCYSCLSAPNNGLDIKVLDRIAKSYVHPFIAAYNGSCLGYAFIREVIEEPPKYHPYESCDEMVEDFKKRFCNHTAIPQFAMPLIWVMTKSLKPKMLITSYDGEFVTLEGVYNKSLEELFDRYTYLDGSPIGKKE